MNQLTFVLCACVLLSSCGKGKRDQLNALVDSCIGVPDDGVGEPSRPTFETHPTTPFPTTPLLEEGLARIYNRDAQGGLVDISLKLAGDGTLTNNQFLTAVQKGERAYRPDLKFIYDKMDPHFEEVSLFANATTIQAWFDSIGMDGGLPRIGLVLSDKISGSANMAVYWPIASKQDQMAQIMITPGDGSILKNLRTDRDVVMHQIAHAVIFRNLQSVTKDALVMHEGLADALTMLRNDDPCFARTVCTAKTTACVVIGEKSCMRTADNNMNWQKDAAVSDSHLKGQIISGMLWDLRKNNVMQPLELARVVMRAIELLNNNSTANEMVMKFLDADKQLYHGIHRNAIISTAEARGFYLSFELLGVVR